MENFYTIYGDERGKIKYECQKLIEQIKNNSDIIRYDMNTTDLLDIIDDASTIAMFSQNKIIILDDCSFLTANKSIPSQEALENYIEHFNKDNILIFLVYNEKIDTRKKINKLLSKHKTIKVEKQEVSDLKQFIIDYLKKEGYKIEDTNYFINKVGKSLPNIKNELDKLIMYKINEKIIKNIDIDKISTYTNEEEIFTLTDAIIAKNKEKSLTLLEEFLNKGYDEIQIIMLLASQFRFFFQVKRLLNKNKTEKDIAKILEANPYRVKFTIKKLYRYAEQDLLEYIQKIAKMDHDIKLGQMDKHLALELFIITNT